MSFNLKKTDKCNSKCVKCKKYHKHHHDCDSDSDNDQNDHRNYCVDRNFGSKAFKLRCKLGKLQYKPCPAPLQENPEEIKYKPYNYNGSFTKPLNHNGSDGRLISNGDYENMRNAILNNDQILLSTVPLAPGSTAKFVNPLASLATTLIGGASCSFNVDVPPSLSSDAGAADIVENYSLALARDVSFINFSIDATITTILNASHMNKPDILANLRYYVPVNVAFTAQTLFRGIGTDELVGPYISQLLLLDVPMGAGKLIQKYTTLLPRGGPTVEWGVNATDTISIQNGVLTGLAALAPAIDPTKRYIFNGRSLAEAVHNDPAYQYFYQASLILSALGALPNPGFPVYPNQTGFITGFGGPDVTCSIAEVTALALEAAWYYKWVVHRKLRPDVFALWVHNVKNSIVTNSGNFDLSNVVLNNGILTDILGLYGNYTLPMCYREGCPSHPAYPSGHATIAGACSTIIKMFYDCEKPWASLAGVISGTLSNSIAGPVQADATGSNLVAYTGTDVGALSIFGEVNKLASNVATGRNWSGVHYRSDGVQGMLLGEQIAIKYMGDKLAACVENNLDGTVPEITFRLFNGTYKTIIPTSCKKKNCH